MIKTKLLGVVAALAFFGVVSPTYSSSCSEGEECSFLYSGGTYTILSDPLAMYTNASGCHSACNFGSDAISMIFTATQVAPINLA